VSAAMISAIALFCQAYPEQAKCQREILSCWAKPGFYQHTQGRLRQCIEKQAKETR
jgi:hypothetical protein